MIVNLKKYFKFEKLEKCKTLIIEIKQYKIMLKKVHFDIQLEQAFSENFVFLIIRLFCNTLGQEKIKRC